jgi:type II secretory pathway pseudopilin PulG
MRHQDTRHKAKGASILELMVGLLILGVVTAGIFAQLNTATQRIATEQSKVDNFDEARDFVDQFFRDINQIGYPDGHIVQASVSPAINDPRIAVGLVQIDQNSIGFEGDINGSGVVQEVIYKINGSGSCSLCFQRSAVAKTQADPYLQQTSAASWGTEVNDLILTNAIFTYYTAAGIQIPTASLPANIDTTAGQQTLASVKTIHISLTIQNNQVMDPKTGQPIQTSFEGEVSLNNCSYAYAGINPMSCF